ncbi:hypothetical protein SIN07_07605 [Pediococcus inopinatus]|uniref:Uncharacterized protein n=1 Tax=Pediococcus inopinatus TaxID=114090 RepID=A0ABZ0Q7W4_9LACO|nr:hypothetical protein [Pediococcus inopinatus]AVK99454.1 hypothetical protein PI20285_01620 [Pediococcus inopinatus]KRN62128.1 hypothetical protein IV83_GL000360 [Pediococcus inopinatus]WPC17224.1 hypothetical protein N6G94_08560 [Pediococcus inopinatus]WPC20499.1 hypothetical protein N6G95_04755 [Pediococcus inopinatus]WPC22202.1 hypothetical protein N6G96_02990 [Pediococcus inopinatus]
MNERQELTDKQKKQKITKTMLWALVVIVAAVIASATHHNIWVTFGQLIVTFFALREVLKI